MRGIEYVIDDAGNKKAVLIDLSLHQDLWEDLADQLTAHEREGDPRLRGHRGRDVGNSTAA